MTLQETSDNVSSVAMPRTHDPGKASKLPPKMAPLDAVLPADMRLAHTSTTLELMQAHASTNETKKRDTRRQRDVQRWREEAREVRDALLLRDEAQRSTKVDLVNRMAAVAVGDDDDDAAFDGTSGATARRLPSRAFGDEKILPRTLSRSHTVQWVQAYRPEQGAAEATAKAREARKAALAVARAAARKKAEEKAARKAADPRSSFQKALDVTRRALGLERAYAAARVRETARREAAAAEKAAATCAARRDAALDANVWLRDELCGSVSREREDALRARFRERAAEVGEVLADDGESRRGAPVPFLCVIERGRVEIRVALGDEGPDDDGGIGADGDAGDSAETARERPRAGTARTRTRTRTHLGFGPSRLVATLSRGHAFAVDGTAAASLFGCPARATFAVVVRDAEDAKAPAEGEGSCFFWELRHRAAFAAMAPSLLRRRAAFAALWASVPEFDAFSEPARAFFMDTARRVTRHPGAHFCVEHKPCDALGVVEAGRVIAHREARGDLTEAGPAPEDPPKGADATARGSLPRRVSDSSNERVSRRVILGEYARGDFFGALPSLRASPRSPPARAASATVTARDVTSALVVTRAAFHRLFGGTSPPDGFDRSRNADTPTRASSAAETATATRLASADFDETSEDGFAAPGVSGPAAAEDRAWALVVNRAPRENSAVARLLLDALLRTPPFVAVGRPVAANAEAAMRRMRPRRVRVGDALFRRGEPFIAGFVVQTGALRLIGDDHGGELADEHVEIPEDIPASLPDCALGARPRPFGDAGAHPARAEPSRASASLSRGAGRTSVVAFAKRHRAPGAGSGSRVVAELGPGDACGFAALPHPGSGATWQCSAAAAAAPGSPGAWVTVWELGLKDFSQTAGYAVDDKRDRFASLLRPETCPALAGLTERQRLRAADALDHATYEDGDLILARGAPSADGAYVLMRGVAVEETSGAATYASFPASGADGPPAGGASPRPSRTAAASTSASAAPETSAALRRGDVFGTDGVFDGGTRDKSVVAGGRVGARVECAVWRPEALAQLGFLRRALEEFQRRA